MLSCQKNTAINVKAETLLNVAYGSDPKQKMDIYLPANRSVISTKVLIMIHGGGWNSGDKVELTPFVDSMFKHLDNYAVININYRLASAGNLFPAQENDVKSAMEFISKKTDAYRISKKIVLLGVSAGGHLALLQGYKYSSILNPEAIISFFGPTDLMDMYRHPSNSYVPAGLEAVLGKSPLQDSAIYINSSPVNFVTSSSPPTILLHGGLDMLVSSSQSVYLRNKLETEGVPNQLVIYPNEGHGWFGSNLFDSFNKIENFISTYVK